MRTIKLEEVENIMRWRDRADTKNAHFHRQMFDKYIGLVVSWERFKEGNATEYDQQLCYQIHKGLMNGLCKEDKIPLMHLGARIESLVSPDKRFTVRPAMKINQAIALVANMDKKSYESVRKQWNKWKNASSEEQYKTNQIFMSCKTADFS